MIIMALKSSTCQAGVAADGLVHVPPPHATSFEKHDNWESCGMPCDSDHNVLVVLAISMLTCLRPGYAHAYASLMDTCIPSSTSTISGYNFPYHDGYSIIHVCPRPSELCDFGQGSSDRLIASSARVCVCGPIVCRRGGYWPHYSVVCIWIDQVRGGGAARPSDVLNCSVGLIDSLGWQLVGCAASVPTL